MKYMMLFLLVSISLFAQDTETIPPLKPDQDTTSVLPDGEPFFEYRYELDELKNEIDSLKQVIRVYEKRKAMPEIDPRLLELVRKPELQHRIILNNGTVVLGEIIRETDLELTIRTQLGMLVIDRKHVVKVDEETRLSPHVEWVSDPQVFAYPKKEIIKGRVKNTGQRRADFVRVIAHLWTSTTEEIGLDSAFVNGKEMIYGTGVISDTMIDPGKTADVEIVVSVQDQSRVSYRTFDIHWSEED